MPGETRCECGHPFGLHKRNPQIGDRNECWALDDNQLIAKWCQCRQFQAAGQRQTRAGGQDGE